MQIINLESFGISHIGLQRSNNEDVWAELFDKRFYALADGMGGHQAGEVAAKETISLLCQIMQRLPEATQEESSLYLKEAICETNRRLYEMAEAASHLQGMGTTLCCFLIHENSFIHAHVGDSRIYRLRGTLTALTSDHTIKKEVHGIPYKNVITRAIGTAPIVEPEIGISPLQDGDIYFQDGRPAGWSRAPCEAAFHRDTTEVLFGQTSVRVVQRGS